MQLTWALPHPIDQDTADELVKESVYISRDIASFSVDMATNEVVIALNDGADGHAVADKVARYAAAMLRGYRESAPMVYRHTHRRDAGPFSYDVYEELKRRRWLFEIGPGHFGFAGPALRLMQAIDRYAEAHYKDQFGAEERSFPALIGADLLTRCGYFESHPNNATFVTHLVEDFDAIEAFRQANLNPLAPHAPEPEALEPPHTCLNPAACFPAYYTLEQQTVPVGGLALTWLGRVFRYESKNTTALERLWEFNVRELVFVGDEQYILRQRERAVAFVCDLAAAFDLELTIQRATDPFFATVAAAKKMWQQSMEAKYEIRVLVGHTADGGARSIAAGSVNVHGTFFGQRFAIRTEAEQPAMTACVGLGIERLVFAAFTQHGFDEGRWPEPLRAAIF